MSSPLGEMCRQCCHSSLGSPCSVVEAYFHGDVWCFPQWLSRWDLNELPGLSGLRLQLPEALPITPCYPVSIASRREGGRRSRGPLLCWGVSGWDCRPLRPWLPAADAGVAGALTDRVLQLQPPLAFGTLGGRHLL